MQWFGWCNIRRTDEIRRYSQYGVLSFTHIHEELLHRLCNTSPGSVTKSSDYVFPNYVISEFSCEIQNQFQTDAPQNRRMVSPVRKEQNEASPHCPGQWPKPQLARLWDGSLCHCCSSHSKDQFLINPHWKHRFYGHQIPRLGNSLVLQNLNSRGSSRKHSACRRIVICVLNIVRIIKKSRNFMLQSC
jgi:hypothetical protein